MITDKCVRSPLPVGSAIIEQIANILIGNLLDLIDLGKIYEVIYNLTISAYCGHGEPFNVLGVIEKLLRQYFYVHIKKHFKFVAVLFPKPLVGIEPTTYSFTSYPYFSA